MSITSRNHRTAVTVFTPDNPSDAYRERAAGLVGSLNRAPDYASGGTIKVDVYSVDERGNVTKGLNWPTATATSVITAEDLVAQAKAAGYTQVVPVFPTDG